MFTMSTPGVTLPRMGKQKPQGGSAAPSRGKKVIYATVPAPLAEALERYIKTIRPRPDKSAVVEAALEDFLASQGHWPSPSS